MLRVHYKQLKKWILHPVLMGLVAVMTIACKPESSTVSSSPASPVLTDEVSLSKSSTPKPVPQDQAIYRSDRFGFQFSYSLKDFVVNDAAATPASKDDSPLAAIDIWTQEHSQAIRSGTYEKGTEYPANVRVTVSSNPQRLPLQKWVQQNNQFAVTREFKDATVAGQKAIAFQSSGLYENEHFAFSSPNGSNIITVTFSKINYGDHDAIYQKAFKQVVNSFTFIDG